jgi:hypothetical protein
VRYLHARLAGKGALHWVCETDGRRRTSKMEALSKR